MKTIWQRRNHNELLYPCKTMVSDVYMLTGILNLEFNLYNSTQCLNSPDEELYLKILYAQRAYF